MLATEQMDAMLAIEPMAETPAIVVTAFTPKAPNQTCIPKKAH